jgi:ATP-binding cassette, subfamily C, bacteriocin exporter
MKSKIRIKQHDITDCGAACLASVAAHYNYKLPISRIRQYASTDQKGTNLLGLVEAAGKIGFSAKGVRGDFDSLFKIPKPAIAHIVVKNMLHHFVVIYKVTKAYVLIMDPTDGKLHKLSHEDFKKQWTGILVLIAPNEEFKAGDEKVSVFQRFWWLVKPHKSVMFQALIGAMVYTLLGLSTSVFVQKIVDHVLIDGNLKLLNLMGTVMIILLLLQIFIGSAKSVFVLKTGQKIDAQLILGYYKHLLKLPQRFFDTMRVGEIMSRVNDAVKIRAFINDVAIDLVVSLFIVVFSFGLMFTYYWKLALIMLAIVPFYLLIYFITNRLNRKTQRRQMEDAAEVETQLVESLNSVGTIKKFGLESFTNTRTEVRFIKLMKTVYRSGINSILAANTSEFVSRLFTIILLWIGASYVLQNEISPGELLSFYAIIGYFTGPVSRLIGMNKTVQDAMIAADRLFELMDLEREESENKIELKAGMTGDIEFKEVSFRYGSRAKVFEKLNLTIPKGKVTAIVGESGSGKSTLASVIQKVYTVDSGQVMLGDYDLKYISNDSLRKLIAVVPQKVDLFAGNVIDNIAVGEHQPDMQKILTICKSLGILPFIESLPHGFNTYLGENGASLSGGQKQRIAIARALYREPEVLILDEATSSLDSASEQYVQQAIEMLREKNKTILIIAHRLSTIYKADKIVVLEKGEVKEEGSHQSLMNNKAGYYNLWKQQFPLMEDFEKSVV